MKKLQKALLAVFAVFFVSAAVGLPAHANTYSDAEAAAETFYTAAQEFSTDMNSAASSDDTAAVNRALASFQSAAATAKSEFTNVANKAKDATAKSDLQDLASAADKMSVSAGQMAAAIESEDNAALTTAYQDFTNAANAYDDAATAYTNYVAKHPEQTGNMQLMFYLGLFILSCVLLVGSILFVVLVGRKHKNAELKSQRGGLIIAALVMTGGAAWTYFSCRAAFSSTSGKYDIVYGPIIFGFILFVLGVVNYVKGYNKAKKEGKLSETAAPVKIPEIKDGVTVAKKPTEPTSKKPIIK